MNTKVEFQCLLCGDQLERLIQGGAITRKEYQGIVSDICRCTNCGHIQFYPLPKVELLNDYYSSHIFYDANPFPPEHYYNTWVEEKHSFKVLFIESLRALKAAYFPPGEKPILYDYACGHGGLIAKTLEVGFNSRGSEMDQGCVEFCNSKSLSVKLGGMDLLAKEKNLDIITCYHSLEHFLNPQEFIEISNSALKDNGFLVMALPNGAYYPAQEDFFGKFDWCFFPEHLHYFTPSSIHHVLFKNHFEVISMTSNSLADTQLNWLQQCSVGHHCDLSFINLSALSDFHDMNLSARDLRVIARKKINPKPFDFPHKNKFQLRELASGNIGGIIFTLKGLDTLKATPRLIINVQTHEKLHKNYKIILHLRSKDNKNATSENLINLDFYPSQPTSTWETKKSFDIYVPLLIDKQLTCYQIDIGLMDTDLSSNNNWILYQDMICTLGTLCP